MMLLAMFYHGLQASWGGGDDNGLTGMYILGRDPFYITSWLPWLQLCYWKSRGQLKKINNLLHATQGKGEPKSFILFIQFAIVSRR